MFIVEHLGHKREYKEKKLNHNLKQLEISITNIWLNWLVVKKYNSSLNL